jgi:hypothetical protein
MKSSSLVAGAVSCSASSCLTLLRFALRLTGHRRRHDDDDGATGLASTHGAEPGPAAS